VYGRTSRSPKVQRPFHWAWAGMMILALLAAIGRVIFG
jgi:hypothetical protein